jgi:chromosome segregation ATPase
LGARDEEVASLEIRLSEATNQVTSKQAELDSLKAEFTRLSVP